MCNYKCNSAIGVSVNTKLVCYGGYVRACVWGGGVGGGLEFCRVKAYLRNSSEMAACRASSKSMTWLKSTNIVVDSLDLMTSSSVSYTFALPGGSPLTPEVATSPVKLPHYP